MSQNSATGFVSSLSKGIKVLNSFAGNNRSMTLTEVAELTNMTRAAARRYLITLTELGYLQMEGRYFSLTTKVLTFSAMYLSSDALPDVVAPYLHELAGQVHESCSVSQLHGDEIIYVARVPTTRIMSVNLQVGARLPAWCTSMGRVQMAYLAEDKLNAMIERTDFSPPTNRTVTTAAALRALLLEIKQQGYALVDQELEEGVISIAVPLFKRNGTVMASLNVAAHRSRADSTKLIKDVLPLLQTTANSISSTFPG